MLREARDFGLTNIKNIVLSIDKCVTADWKHTGEVQEKFTVAGFSGPVAHTHKCMEDPWFNYICIPKWAVVSKQGGPTSIFWHEYGHYLDTDVECSCKDHIFTVTSESDRIIKELEFTKRVHGKSFISVMEQLGKPELAIPSIDITMLIGEIV